MRGTNKGIVLAVFSPAVVASLTLAEPSHLVYPASPAVFRYDASRYEVVAPGDPKFDPAFAVGGQMLWDRVEARVPVEIYRAPSITAFELSASGLNEFVAVGNDLEIVIDGFGPAPRTIGGLCVAFLPEPNQAYVQMEIDGRLITGLTHALPTLEVSNAAGGGYYADTSRFVLSWIGASSIRIVAFSDKNADRTFDGSPRYTVIVHDAVVPVASTTWGRIKAMYRD